MEETPFLKVGLLPNHQPRRATGAFPVAIQKENLK